MKNFPSKIRAGYAILGILLCTLFMSTTGNGQARYQAVGGVKIIIEGTSNLHDWDMKSDKGTCTAIFDMSNSGALAGGSFLNFSLAAESLKSEHSSMDKNTYKALNTGKYPTISFTSSSVTIKPAGSAGYILTTSGKLTIAGVTKDVSLSASGVVNADKSISYSGSYQLKMTDYNVTPPTMMLGAIKTGDKIVVKYNLVLKAM